MSGVQISYHPPYSPFFVAPLFILRHGETSWNAEGRLQGRLDSPLTPKGEAQAAVQRHILAQQDLRCFRLISSPLGRAQATAEIACAGLDGVIETDPDLMEIDMGAFSGQLRDPLLAEHGVQDGFDLYDLAPGGEGFAGLKLRCQRFLAALDGPAVLITHGITSRMLRLILLGRAGEDVRDMGGGQGVVYHVQNGTQTCLQQDT